ncbi:hypothetical protein AT251_17675 [Enterovibrio nigricans]|nr:hypothetical protein [Enterovibrio nigricans]PKF49597.1 hypothetical protein AT251_17675 [Enterovibrio nigricans]
MWPLPDNEPLDRLPGCLPFPCGEGNGDSPPLKKPLVAVLRYTLVNGQSLSAGDGGLPNTNSTAELANLPNVFLLNGLDTNGPEGDSLTLDRIQSLKVFAEYDTFSVSCQWILQLLADDQGIQRE